ncbi:MAG: translation elongation factor Ts [Pseudomonadota bacterium]
MSISAQQVKELRERTGLGMMECKAALTEANGDMQSAEDILRMKAGAKVEKKAGRTAADGAIGLHLSADGKLAAMIEINSETDFVAKGDNFVAFAVAVAARLASSNPATLAALSALPLKVGDATTIAQSLEGMVMKLGEKITLRRFVRLTTAGRLGTYLHGRKIGVLVEVEGGDDDLAKDLAMHIAASRPTCVSKDQVPAELIAKEKEIFAEQAKQSGKPANIVDKMVEGRVNKFLSEVTLLGQPFVKDPDTTVEKLLKAKNARVLGFTRYEVGEGIEKRADDFAAEVMAQVRGG